VKRNIKAFFDRENLRLYIKERIGLFIFIVVSVIVILWGYVSINRLRNSAGRRVVEYIPREANVDFDNTGEYITIAETDDLALLFNGARGSIWVYDKTPGYMWKGIADTDVYPEMDRLNRLWESYLQSMIFLTFNNTNVRDGTPANLYSNTDCDYITYDYIAGGVSVTYGFTAYGLFLTVEYTLEDELVIRIPGNKLIEESTYVFNMIELMPFFGAATNDIDGYMFYPDGCGGITRYANYTERASNPNRGIWSTFSSRRITFEDIENYERNAAPMPIFGIKNDNNAVLAVCTEGMEDIGITAYPSGTTINLNINRIGFEMYMRNIFYIDLYNVTGDSGVTNSRTVQRFDRNLTPGDRELRYFFLRGDRANYSGMADTYRNYLIGKGQLKRAIRDGDTLPLALTMLMGVTRESMIFDEFVKMTSFKEVEEILHTFNRHGITDIHTVLDSWQRNGQSFPYYWPVASQLGGGNGLEDLNEFVKTNTGNRVYLSNDFVYANDRTNGLSRGFSTTRDIVYDGVALAVTAGYNTLWYLLNPQVSYNNSVDFLDKLSKYDRIGVGHQYLTRYVYPDYNTYNDRGAFTRRQTVAKWKEILRAVVDDNRPLAADGYNQYVYESAEYIYDISERTFGLSITDEAVPFVQMVLSGLIPYSTGRGNLSYDLDIQKLKWIEFGSLPSFILTYENTVNLKNSGYDHIFTSTFRVWEERIVDTYNEFRENFQLVYGRQMTWHERIEEGVVCVEYENGIRILLNYNENARTVDGISIPAKGYVILNG